MVQLGVVKRCIALHSVAFSLHLHQCVR